MTNEIQKDKNNSQALLFVDRLMDTIDIVVSQVTSGRWLLTIAAGVCLVHFAWSAENKDKVIDIIKDIVIFYFVVRDANKPTSLDKPNGGQTNETTKIIGNTGTITSTDPGPSGQSVVNP